MQENPRVTFKQWLQHHSKSYSEDMEVHRSSLAELQLVIVDSCLDLSHVSHLSAVTPCLVSPAEKLVSLITMQEFEHRLAVWLDNAEFVREYNEKHTSHWVSRFSAAS